MLAPLNDTKDFSTASL